MFTVAILYFCAFFEHWFVSFSLFLHFIYIFNIIHNFGCKCWKYYSLSNQLEIQLALTFFLSYCCLLKVSVPSQDITIVFQLLCWLTLNFHLILFYLSMSFLLLKSCYYYCICNKMNHLYLYTDRHRYNCYVNIH